MTKNWDDFVQAVGARESSNNYRAKNQFGYLGRFQFGKARLKDMGLVSKQNAWLFGLSESLFLNSPGLQNAVFATHVARHRAIVVKRYAGHIGQTVDGVLLTLSGIIACFHLLGEGGFRDFVRGKNKKDGNGTSAKDYLTKFAGYEIPSDLPVHHGSAFMQFV